MLCTRIKFDFAGPNCKLKLMLYQDWLFGAWLRRARLAQHIECSWQCHEHLTKATCIHTSAGHLEWL